MKNKPINLLLYIILAFSLLTACSETNLDKALSLAGDNRAELEKVLNHYSENPKDSLKYKAACFLIENMPGHYSYKDTVYIKKYYNEIDSVLQLYKDQPSNIKEEAYRSVKDKYNVDLEHIADISFIKASYLIDNIERSFNVWENEPWAKHVNFEDFCEYILPYKVTETQTLDNWREYFSDYSTSSLKELQYCELYKNLASKACEIVNNDLKNNVHPSLVNEVQIPIRRMSTLHKIPYGLCEDYAFLALSVMRAKGIPTAVDFTPQWPFRSQGHSWNVLLENSGMNVIFEGANTAPGTPHKKDHKMAKVFRKTYAINREIEQLLLSEKHVPPAFEEPFIKDVTNEYLKTTDIEVAIKDNKHKYVYLAVFDNENWIPIHWAEVKNGKAIFKNMGRNVVYLPVAYGLSGIIPVSNPLILDMRGNLKKLDPDTTTKHTVEAKRKYPIFEQMYNIIKIKSIANVQIQASNDSLFNDVVTLATTKEYGINAEEIIVDRPENYRYWRFYKSTPGGGNFFLAEIFFFKKDSINPSYGRIIGSEGSFWNLEKDNKESAFDRDALTIFDGPFREDSFVGMDFGKPVPIGKIVYLPRSDGNLIEPGDEYELVYWQDDKWQSLGKQKAKGASLRFENCPDNALFLLHNHTKGKEERIFTYENRKQIWW